jgi:hypothetical protein
MHNTVLHAGQPFQRRVARAGLDNALLGCAGNGATLQELRVWAIGDFIRGVEARARARPHAQPHAPCPLTASQRLSNAVSIQVYAGSCLGD